MTNLLLLVALITGIDYDKIDKIPYGQSCMPEPGQHRFPVRDASVQRILREREGLHLLILRDRPTDKAKTEWRPWIDIHGRPWLIKDVDTWYIRLWQAPEWRTWSFGSDDAWTAYWTANPTSRPPAATENYGISGDWKGAGSTSSECAQHLGQPCPGPGPCPRPGPRPGPDDRSPFFPDLSPKVNVNIDPMILWVAVGGIGFLGITMLGLIAVVLIRRRTP